MPAHPIFQAIFEDFGMTPKPWPGRGYTPVPADEKPDLFIHVTPKADACEHDFQGWRDFEDSGGGEQVCTKCGMGAMEHTLRTGL